MEFKIMGSKGDAVYDYDLETAEVKFNELLSRGLHPMAAGPDNKYLPAKVFKPEVEKYLWLPRIAGG